MSNSKKPKKVAIVGFTGSRARAPYDDESYEIWGLNALYVHEDVKRATRWFDLHDPGIIPAARIEQYQKLGVPVFLQAQHTQITKSVEFPAVEIQAEMKSEYFTNSISWMIALAIKEEFDVIEVYGVDMAADGEYATQRPNVEYWLGRAAGEGIEVTVADTSDLLFATHQYGYGSDNGLRKKLKEREVEFVQRMTALEGEIEKLQLGRATVDGALQNTRWMLRSLTVMGPGADTPDLAAVAPELAAVGD